MEDYADMQNDECMSMTEDDIKSFKSCRDRLGKPVKTKVAKEEKPK